MRCPICDRETTPTPTGKFRKHGSPPCDASGTKVPDPEIPGVTQYAEGLAAAARNYGDTRGEVEALYAQPASSTTAAARYSQPATPASNRADAVPMSPDAAELAARLKEIFYGFQNRRSADNRSAQRTLGPSEVGVPCDRRLALSVMRMPPCNPGGDGWASFVGTAIHASLADVFLWANQGSGRFAVEQRLEFDSKYVPHGTADLIDRTLFMLGDHKCQGRWSRNKLKREGPSQQYRVQAHVYAYGARQRGEKIEKVAIISWPRDESTLDDLYVHIEDYDPTVARDAFARVERIGQQVEERLSWAKVDVKEELASKALVASEFDVDPEGCTYCPFYLPGARSILDGCNGKR